MNFIKLLSSQNINLDDQKLEQFEKYAQLLVEWNEKFNLTAITQKDDIYLKHFLDCLLLTKYNLTGSLVDIGTGAGFPAIVLKIANPQLNITMLEPNNKKILFLNTVINELGLKNIEAINQRSEDYAKENFQKFDYATSRAVAALNILDELALPLVKKNGHFLVMKGPKANEEIADASKGIELLGGKVTNVQLFSLFDEATRYIIDIEKVKDTPNKYPRNYSQIKKKPL